MERVRSKENCCLVLIKRIRWCCSSIASKRCAKHTSWFFKREVCHPFSTTAKRAALLCGRNPEGRASETPLILLFPLDCGKAENNARNLPTMCSLNSMLMYKDELLVNSYCPQSSPATVDYMRFLLVTPSAVPTAAATCEQNPVWGPSF